jgi:hypothetical protein
MEDDLVIEATPLFILTSAQEEEKQPLNNEKRENKAEADGKGSRSSDSSVFPQDLFPLDTNFLTTDSIDEEGLSSQTKNTDRNNNTRQESTRMLDIIKHSPKFLRKKNTKQPCKNVTASPVEDNNDILQDVKPRGNVESLGSVSPKIAIRKKFQQLSGNSKDTTTETLKMLATSPVKCKSPTYDQESSEAGSSKGKKNWRKVKAALKRMNHDSGEELKPVSPGNEVNSQEVPKITIKIPSESSIHDSTENEEDIYQRLKTFLNSSEKKPKTPKSPRLQLRSKFNFWPKGPEEENDMLSSPVSNQFPVLKTRMYHLGIRRSSAPESVLRREAEAFSLAKKAKDIRLNAQNKSIKQAKGEKGVSKVSNRRNHEIKQRIQLVMKENLESVIEYCPDVCSQFSSTISEQINKYLHSTETTIEGGQKKFVCLVYIGAVKDCGIYAAVRGMWSPGEDRLVVADYQNKSLYAIAVVFVASC